MNLEGNHANSYRVMLTAFLAGIVLAALWVGAVQAEEPSDGKLQTVAVTLGAKTIHAALANTTASRIQGLLGWNSIDDDTGMLLDFLVDTKSAIHMEGMKFPIDAIWADTNGEIKLIYEDIQPNKGLTYPSMFPSRYCLEVKAGFCKKYGVKAGQKIRFGAE